jgi:hypothetical protein
MTSGAREEEEEEVERLEALGEYPTKISVGGCWDTVGR